MKAGKVIMWVLILIGASVVGWLIFKFTLGIMVAIIALVGGIIGYAVGNIAGRMKMRRKYEARIEEMENKFGVYN